MSIKKSEAKEGEVQEGKPGLCRSPVLYRRIPKNDPKWLMGPGRLYEKTLFYDGESIKLTRCFFLFFLFRGQKNVRFL